jgi:hypothetical protein
MYDDSANQNQPSTTGAYPYRRGAASAARPTVDYSNGANVANSNSSFPAYNPYATTAPAPQRQQQELDWYSSSIPMTHYPATNEVKVAAAPSPYATVPQPYPASHSDGTYYNAAGTAHPMYATNDPNAAAPTTYSSSLKKTESVELLNNPYSSGITYSNSLENLSGTMKSNPYATAGSYTNFFQASMNNNSTPSTTASSSYYQEEDFANEPPLLEELGINISHITTKSLAVLLPMSRRYAKSSEILNPHTIEESPDLAGPLAFAILLGSELLLAGKIHFAYIYSLSLFCCVSMTLLLYLLSPNQSISIWTVISVLGYCLLPVNLVAAVNVFIRISSMKRVGLVLAAMTILWCSVSATRLFETGCNLREQRWLVGYPCVLLYSCFLMITIF